MALLEPDSHGAGLHVPRGGVSLRGVGKAFGRERAVSGLDLEIAPGEFLALVGPSGSGKSTTLRLIAGLEEPDDGEIGIGGLPMEDVPARDRDVAMVFQSYALYPHMTVFRNLATPLELRRVPRPQIERRVTEAAELLDIAYLLNRKPRQLSGGQRQRVALARAMVRNPALFLFDEPLSQLDAQQRVALRGEIAAMHRRVGASFVYVTHDQAEAAAMADRIAVMRAGRVEQVASPQELYARPASLFVATFFGAPQMNLLPAWLAEDGTAVTATGTVLRLPRFAAAAGQDVIVGIRPEQLSDAPLPHAPDAAPGFETVVHKVEPMGATIAVEARAGDQRLVARLPSRSRVRPGDRLPLWVEPDAVHLFDAATEAALPRLARERLN